MHQRNCNMIRTEYWSYALCNTSQLNNCQDSDPSFTSQLNNCWDSAPSFTSQLAYWRINMKILALWVYKQYRNSHHLCFHITTDASAHVIVIILSTSQHIHGKRIYYRQPYCVLTNHSTCIPRNSGTRTYATQTCAHSNHKHTKLLHPHQQIAFVPSAIQSHPIRYLAVSAIFQYRFYWGCPGIYD